MVEECLKPELNPAAPEAESSRTESDEGTETAAMGPAFRHTFKLFSE
jgi:hypothetical protein